MTKSYTYYRVDVIGNLVTVQSDTELTVAGTGGLWSTTVEAAFASQEAMQTSIHEAARTLYEQSLAQLVAIRNARLRASQGAANGND